MKKEYPIVKNNRMYFVQTPVMVTDQIIERYKKFRYFNVLEIGNYIALNVLPDGDYGLITFPLEWTEEQCQISCDVHNKSHGWTPEEVDEIIYKYIGIKPMTVSAHKAGELCEFKVGRPNRKEEKMKNTKQRD